MIGTAQRVALVTAWVLLGTPWVLLGTPFFASVCVAGEPGAPSSFILATTTSTQDSGLLDVLIPAFERESGVGVKTIAVGTGAALALGARGEADALLVHAPDAEERWMREGHGVLRLPVMHNEFVIAGPASDPASIRGTPSVTAALDAIATRGTRWISRDDGSGTDLLEKRLWSQSAHPALAAKSAPGAPGWFIRSGQGMGATLLLAATRQACTLTDRGTLLAWRARAPLDELVRGDPRLRNEYHVITVRPEKLAAGRIKSKDAERFARWITGAAAQQLIRTFGVEKYGEPLFHPAATSPSPPAAR